MLDLVTPMIGAYEAQGAFVSAAVVISTAEQICRCRGDLDSSRDRIVTAPNAAPVCTRPAGRKRPVHHLGLQGEDFGFRIADFGLACLRFIPQFEIHNPKFDVVLLTRHATSNMIRGGDD